MLPVRRPRSRLFGPRGRHPYAIGSGKQLAQAQSEGVRGSFHFPRHRRLIKGAPERAPTGGHLRLRNGAGEGRRCVSWALLLLQGERKPGSYVREAAACRLLREQFSSSSTDAEHAVQANPKTDSDHGQASLLACHTVRPEPDTVSSMLEACQSFGASVRSYFFSSWASS